MEPVSLVIGVVGLAGLYTSCLDAFDKARNYKKFRADAQELHVQLEVERLRLSQWGQRVGFDQSHDALRDDHHSALDNPKIFQTVCQALTAIKDIFDSKEPGLAERLSSIGSKNAESKREKAVWAFRGKETSTKRIEVLRVLVQGLHDVVPPKDHEEQSSGENHARELKSISALLDDQSSWLSELQKIIRRLDEDEQAEMLKKAQSWILGSTSQGSIYDRLIRIRIDGTCDWILGHSTFKQWLSFGDHEDAPFPRVLWINGPPGFGKTILCSRLVKYLKGEKNFSPVAHFFIMSNNEIREDPLAVVRIWVSQLITVNSPAYGVLRDGLLTDQSQVASDTTVLNLLHQTLQSLPSCTLIVDGLDECSSGNSVKSSVDDLLNAAKSAAAGTKTRILVVSRETPSIRSALERAASTGFLNIRISPDDVAADIASYSSSIVEHKLSNKAAEVRADISTQLATRCQGQFLWLKVQSNDLTGGLNKKQLQRVIEETPTGLDALYDRNWNSLNQFNLRDKSRALRLLRWVAFSVRPLTIQEITNAVLIDQKDNEFPIDELPDEFDAMYIQDQILRLSVSLVDMQETSPDEPIESRTLVLAHFSVKEYLLSALSTYHGLKLEKALLPQDTEAQQHSLLAKLCLHYINRCCTSQAIEAGQMPLWEYVAASWYVHVRQGVPDDEDVSKSINALFDIENPQWNAWRSHFDAAAGWEKQELDSQQPPLQPLFYASLIGLSQIVSVLHEKDPHMVNLRMSLGRTALGAAAANGHSIVVEQLLNLGADVCLKDDRGVTALTLAVFHGQIHVVDMILDYCKGDLVELIKDQTTLIFASRRGPPELVGSLLSYGWSIEPIPVEFINATGWGENGLTALHCAVKDDSFDKVKLLLDAGLDPSATFESGLSGNLAPIQIVSHFGNSEIARLLLERGANVNSAEGVGPTALHIASSKGHLETVKVLYEFNATISPASKRKVTPLHEASGNGHLAIVRFLVGSQADPNEQTAGGSTSLLLAAEYGHIDIVEFLYNNGASLNPKTTEGFTPLLLAAQNGYIKVVQFLDDRSVDLNAQTAEGVTPMLVAAEYGHIDIVEFLYNNGASLNPKTTDGFTPLLVAARSGHFGVVELLCNYGANLNQRLAEGYTPLPYAATENHVETVKYLYNRGAGFDPQATAYGRTSLMILAAMDGHKEVLTDLKTGGTDRNPATFRGFTPLMFAAFGGHLEILEFLIDRGADLNLQDDHGRSALYMAATGGHEAIVQALCRRDADLDMSNTKEITQLISAAYFGHLEVVKALCEAGANIHSRTSETKRTALDQAVTRGHAEVVRMLIDCGADYVFVQGSDLWPLLVTAAALGHSGVCRALLERGMSPDTQDNEDGVAALHCAAQQNHMETAQLLITWGANYDLPDHHGHTSLMLASFEGHYEMVRFLCEQGADKSVVNRHGAGLLHVASANGHLKVIELLIEYGANINRMDEWGAAPLHVASRAGHSEIVEHLLQKGAATYLSCFRGYSPLFAACANGHLDVVTVLLAHEERSRTAGMKIEGVADTSQSSDVGDEAYVEYLSPLRGAITNGHMEVVKVLLQRGSFEARWKEKDSILRNPLQWAVHARQQAMVDMLVQDGADLAALFDGLTIKTL